MDTDFCRCWAVGSVSGEKRQTGASLLPMTRCVSPDVQLLCGVIGSDWVMLSDKWTDNGSGAYQCQQIGSPAKCMIAITALVMYSVQNYCATPHDVCLQGQ